MRVPYSWLQEYIDCGLPAREVADRLTQAGVEVEALEPFLPPLDRVVAARVTGVRRHPGSEKLTLVTVDPGGAPVTVVCGASNVSGGQVVPLALPGAVLPGERRIEAARILGESSGGMLCSPRELGLDLGDAAEEGILILEPDLQPGTAVSEILQFDDPVLYLGLTPNRADCQGMLGVAHEVAALTGAPVIQPPLSPAESGPPASGAAAVRVLDSRLCPRYTARVIEDIVIGPAPLWMQLRLLKAGIRPINNIVDITNYVMWEMGQPLHAFDLDRVSGREIIVRPAAPGETLVTLDGAQRRLDGDVLVIADRSGPIGLAGVMGGENTEIGPATRRVLLEAARFDPVSIRRTARRFNLPSEASQRFERGINPEATAQAQDRASRLMAQYGGGHVLPGVIDFNPEPPEPRRLAVRPRRVNDILGLEIPAETMREILTRLDFSVTGAAGETMEVTVPLRRGDVQIEEDVVEEIARLYGYDRVPATLPRGETVAGGDTDQQRLDNLCRDLLIGCGFFEVITLSFINPQALWNLRLAKDDPRQQAIVLQNPLTEEQGIMRTTLVPGLLKVLQHNFSYQEMNPLIFEIGAVFLPERLPLDEFPREANRLAMAVTGRIPEAHWQMPGAPADFFLIKGALEALCRRLRIAGLEVIPGGTPFTHPTRSAQVRIDGAEAGFLGELHPAVADTWDLRQAVTVCELDLDLIYKAATLVPRVVPLSRFPAAWRDVAVLVPRDLPAGDMERAIREAAGELLDRVILFDLYEGDPVPAGWRSLAFRVTLRRPGGTLTDADVQTIMGRVEQALVASGAALRR